MSEVIIVPTDEGEPAAEEVAEAVVDVAEAVAEAIVEAVEAITDDQPAGDTDTALIAGVTLAEVGHINQRLDAVEARLAETTNTAELALDIAVEEPAPVVVDEPEEEPAPAEDVPPATKKSKFSKWWFG